MAAIRNRLPTFQDCTNLVKKICGGVIALPACFCPALAECPEVADSFRSFYRVCKTYCFGEFWNVVTDPTFLDERFKTNLEASKPNIVSLGCLGNVGYFVAAEPSHYKAVMNEADNEENKDTGRLPYTISTYLAGGKNVFFAKGGRNGAEGRKDLLEIFIKSQPSLKSEIKLRIDLELKKMLTDENEDKVDNMGFIGKVLVNRKTISLIVQGVILKSVLGIEDIADDTPDIMNQCSSVMFNRTLLLFPSLFYVLNILPDAKPEFKFDETSTKTKNIITKIRTIRANFIHLSKRLLNPIKIKEQLLKSNDPEKENLLLKHLVRYIKKSEPTIKTDKQLKQFVASLSIHQFSKYLEKSHIRELPFILVATDNIVDAIYRGLIKLSSYNSKYKYQTNLHGFCDKFRKERLEGIDDNCVPTQLPRYFAKGFALFNIPPKTTLFCKTLNSFSDGNRSCPAKNTIANDLTDPFYEKFMEIDFDFTFDGDRGNFLLSRSKLMQQLHNRTSESTNRI